ncbi:MAG: molybdenum cofactor guanylyltransferase [Dehalococcoidia bacterium]
MKPRATGIVLAGGSSQRMGRDKAYLEIGGGTVLRRVLDAVFLVCDDVVIAAGRRSHDFAGIPRVTCVDDPPGTGGPLAGVVAGMRSASNSTCIVVACDMPFVDPKLLAHLLDRLDDCAAAVPVFGGSPQPLQAAYSTTCLPTAECMLRLGDNSMRSLLDRIPVRFIGERQVGRIDPGNLSGFNMNTVADLDFARHHWVQRRQRVATA